MQEIDLNPVMPSLVYNLADATLYGDLEIYGAGRDDINQTESGVVWSADPEVILTPTSTIIGQPALIDFDFGSYPIAVVGTYIFNLIASAFSGSVTRHTEIKLTVIDDDNYNPNPQTPTESFQPKYIIENGEFTATIFELTEDAITPQYVGGSWKLSYQTKDDHFTPIVASNVVLRLDADVGLTFSDLYSENERKFKLEIKKGLQTVFIGWIKPDGIWEDFIADKWQLTIQAFDGLSTLKNISFADNAGDPYRGFINLSDIIFICLEKTGFSLPINRNVDVKYTGLVGQSNYLWATNIKVEAFTTGNKGEAMDCDAVLKNVLTIFNASVVQMNGEWFIYRPNDMKNNVTFDRYVANGFESSNLLPMLKTIGSHIDEYDVFHCSGNQRKSIKPSVQAYRIYYEYKGAINVLDNGELKLNPTGIGIAGWLTSSAPDGLVNRHPSGYGIRSKTAGVAQGTPFLQLNQSIEFKAGDGFKVEFDFEHTGLWAKWMTYAIGVGSKWYDFQTGQWQNIVKTNMIDNSKGVPNNVNQWQGAGRATHSASFQAPEDGTLKIVIYRDVNGYSIDGIFTVHSVSVYPETALSQRGKIYTGYRSQKASTVTKTNQTVFAGDSESELFAGTLFKSDKNTPTTTWERIGVTEEKQLLEINAEDQLRISPRPMIFFEGDVYGWLNFIGKYQINNIPGTFQLVGYSYDSKTNVSNVNLLEYEGLHLENNKFIVDIKDDFNNEAKVTIK